ncbi:MAG: hypothetical protein F4X80_08060 [Chloroflexi bacterium]|nr:hypothetical protein [Chloroflexota bacterium]MYE32587.1 hypothetical protein [Chloroflexota bacterium]
MPRFQIDSVDRDQISVTIAYGDYRATIHYDGDDEESGDPTWAWKVLTLDGAVFDCGSESGWIGLAHEKLQSALKALDRLDKELEASRETALADVDQWLAMHWSDRTG